MNFPFFRPKPIPHKELRYVYPTKREATEAQRQEANRRASINCQLAVYAAVTTRAQRKAEADRYFAEAAIARATDKQKAGRGA